MNLTEIVLFAIPIVIAVTFHEAAHGFVALFFGDDTAKRAGRLTLNPIKHIDPFGTVILPLLLYFTAGFAFGYAKPVPVNFSALRNPRWNMIWVAAAGPGMNVLLAILSGLTLYAVPALEGDTAAQAGNLALLSLRLNVILAVFNMLPLPPLDGSKVLAAFLPNPARETYLNFGRFGMLILLILLLVVPVLSARSGLGFDFFGTLVIEPANWLEHAILSLIGRG